MDGPSVTQPSASPSSSAPTPDLPAERYRSDRPLHEPPSDPGTSDLPALARFEFQAGRGNDGTKILMVEWNASSGPQSLLSASGTWQVSWEGKTSHVPVEDEETGKKKRIYFLLPPGAAVPSVITIAHPDGTAFTTKSLPALFPPGLGAGNSVIGARGILHTIWAKKRLAELEDEIVSEMKTNSEGIGLEIAYQERQWIVEQFGVNLKVNMGVSGSTPAVAPAPRAPSSSMSPKSPIGGKVGQKLKGLKLATSAADLVVGRAGENTCLQPISFSPASNDVAVSSFPTFARQGHSKVRGDAAASLDAVLVNNEAYVEGNEYDQEEDLFALPMSPRSPDMGRSPFSLE
ncbi:hypothetical protein CCHR01_09164 [Colletotrichum chrysophilum]|uniref:Uncharacterized protein n=1 Tax=Colletotrichum chrysophilum TaxID=1836956 RepID=A0AAD9EGZ7_9PEZI|nr:hypothetical protein CCHR01_09164 [Colletotrichum chrysophilum]